VVPVPADWVKPVAATAWPKETSAAFVNVRAPSRTDAPTAPWNATSPPVPPFTVSAWAPATDPLTAPPMVRSAPASEATAPLLVVSITELATSVTAPVPRLIASAELRTVAARSRAALPGIDRPPLNRKMSDVALPSVTLPELSRLTCWAKLLFPPSIVSVYGFAAVTRLFTWTLPEKVADEALEIVRSSTVTAPAAVTAPAVPASIDKSKALAPSVTVLAKATEPPEAEPPAVVVIDTGPDSVTAEA